MSLFRCKMKLSFTVGFLDSRPMITLSPTAASEIRRLQVRHSATPTYLRLQIKPGGCAQLYYDLQFDSTVTSQDQVIRWEDLSILVTLDSLHLLQGVQIDYSEDLMGGSFRFKNPNATQTCSCGNSFALEPQQSDHHSA